MIDRTHATTTEKLMRGSMPEPNSGCRLWLGKLNGCGYGILAMRHADGDWRHTIAHRVAYAAFVGSIPPGLHVLHKCDTPCCIEPTHLFLGTHADNMRDKAMKGRAPSGDRNGMRLHPEAAARGALKRRGRFIPRPRLRGDNNWTRRHPERVLRGENANSAKLTEANVRDIRARVFVTASASELAREFGVYLSTIYRISHRQSWKHVKEG